MVLIAPNANLPLAVGSVDAVMLGLWDAFPLSPKATINFFIEINNLYITKTAD